MLYVLAMIPPAAIAIAVCMYCGIKRPDLKKFVLLFLPVGFIVAEIPMQAGYYLGKSVDAVLGSGVINVVFSNFIIVALMEEGCKYLPLRWRYAKGDPFTKPLHAIAVSVTVSMGFAFWEQIYYTLEGTLSSTILRGLLAVPGHMAHAVFMGWFMYLAAKAASAGDEEGKKKNFRLALLVPTLTHGTYDVIVGMYNLNNSMLYFWLLFIFAPALIIYAIRLLKRAKRIQADAESGSDDGSSDNNNNNTNDVPEVFYE